MAKQKKDITVSQWDNLLNKEYFAARAAKVPEGWHTSEELEKLTDVPKHSMHDRLRYFISQGILETRRFPKVNALGRLSSVLHYKFKSDEKDLNKLKK